MAKDKTGGTSEFAIAGLIVAIFSLMVSWVPILNTVVFFFAIVSLILGIIGLRSIKKGKRVGQGLAVATIIISIMAGGAVLATQAFYGKVVDNVGDSIKEKVNDYDGTNTDKLLQNNVDVTLGQFVFNPGAEADYSYDDTTELPVTVKNKAPEKSSYTIKIEALDANGARIADETIYVNDLGAGQSELEKAFQYVESGKLEAIKTATFRVYEVSK